MKTLYILRHAEALPGSPDEKRQLSPAGHAAAKHLGGVMKEKGWRPAAILCSPATRTRQTLEGLDLSGAKPDFNKAIYHAAMVDLLDLVQDAGRTDSLLLVGHNPAIHGLAAALAGDGREKFLQSVRTTFQPGTLAVLEFEGHWADIEAATGLLKDLVVPE